MTYHLAKVRELSAEDPYAPSPARRDPVTEEVDVLVVGASWAAFDAGKPIRLITVCR
jgi:hypothetical protein